MLTPGKKSRRAYQPTRLMLHSALRQLPEQAPRFCRALGGGLLQPVARLFRLIDFGQAAQPAVFQLRTSIACTGRLSQQLMTYATIAGIAAITTEHLPQPALRHHHTFARGLLEQPAGEMLDLWPVAQPWIIQQPQRNLQGKAPGFGNG